jgi:hypothetical protein
MFIRRLSLAFVLISGSVMADEPAPQISHAKLGNISLCAAPLMEAGLRNKLLKPAESQALLDFGLADQYLPLVDAMRTFENLSSGTLAQIFAKLNTAMERVTDDWTPDKLIPLIPAEERLGSVTGEILEATIAQPQMRVATWTKNESQDLTELNRIVRALTPAETELIERLKSLAGPFENLAASSSNPLSQRISDADKVMGSYVRWLNAQYFEESLGRALPPELHTDFYLRNKLRLDPTSELWKPTKALCQKWYDAFFVQVKMSPWNRDGFLKFSHRKLAAKAEALLAQLVAALEETPIEFNSLVANEQTNRMRKFQNKVQTDLKAKQGAAQARLARQQRAAGGRAGSSSPAPITNGAPAVVSTAIPTAPLPEAPIDHAQEQARLETLMGDHLYPQEIEAFYDWFKTLPALERQLMETHITTLIKTKSFDEAAAALPEGTIIDVRQRRPRGDSGTMDVVEIRPWSQGQRPVARLYFTYGEGMALIVAWYSDVKQQQTPQWEPTVVAPVIQIREILAEQVRQDAEYKAQKAREANGK